jgi:hypothetical protein
MKTRATEPKTNITLYPFVLSSLEAEPETEAPPPQDVCSTPNSEEAEGPPEVKKRKYRIRVMGYSPCEPSKIRPPSRKDFVSRYQAYMERRHVLNQLMVLEEWQVAETVKGAVDARRHPADESQFEVQVVFDDSVCYSPLWISPHYFYKINQIRKQNLLEYTVGVLNKAMPSLTDLTLASLADMAPAKKRKLKESLQEKQVCHHCQKLLNKNDIVYCSKKMRTASGKKMTIEKRSRPLLSRKKPVPFLPVRLQQGEQGHLQLEVLQVVPQDEL